MRKLVLLLFYVISLLIPGYVKPDEPPVLNDYTIYFEENGGTEIADITAQETTEITPETTTKIGYDFAGWYLTEDLSGEKVNLTTMPSGDITLYAKWTPTEYVVTYHLNLGTNHAENPEIYTIEDDTIILQNPTKESYVFDGWYTNAECTTEITQIECATTLSNIDIYAKFSPEKYYVTFKSHNGAETLLQERLVTFGEALPTVEQNGANFAGWSRQVNNTNANLYTTTPDLGTHLAEITLYANWTEKTYAVKFVDFVSETDFAGATFSGTMPSTWTLGTEFNYTVSMNTLYFKEPTSTIGRMFTGYKIYAGKTWQTIDKLDSTCIANEILKEDSTLIIYAVWGEASFCTITFDANGGTFENGSTTAIAGVEEWDENIKNINAPTLAGKTFVGWADSDGELVANAEHQFLWESFSTYFTEIPGYWTYPGTATLYAVWE